MTIEEFITLGPEYCFGSYDQLKNNNKLVTNSVVENFFFYVVIFIKNILIITYLFCLLAQKLYGDLYRKTNYAKRLHLTIKKTKSIVLNKIAKL